MSLLHAIILAIVQGLTEFLPISSSGHLEIGKAILKTTEKDPVTFVVLLHLASVLAVIAFARREIASLLTRDGRPLLILLIAGTIPAAVAGLLLEELLEKSFGGDLLVVGIGLLVTASVLWVGDRAKGGTAEYADFGPGRAAGVGLAQAMAMVPGISRSGSTICAAMLMGLERERAVRFSFLLAVPIILGASAKKALDADSVAAFFSLEYSVAFGVCFLVSLGALQLLLGVVRKKKLIYFSIYCAVVGFGCILWPWVS